MDKLCWKLACWMFEVHSYYKTLTHDGMGSFPWKSIWKPKVPPIVAFFTWAASLGKILIADNFRKRKCILVSWYCLCKGDEEIIDHLLLHYLYSCELWSLFLLFLVFSGWCPPGVIDLFASWQGLFGKHRCAVFWRVWEVNCWTKTTDFSSLF